MAPVRSWSLLLAVLLLATACGGQGDGVTADDGGLEEVAFALSWLPVSDAAGWYSAWDLGWFEEEGIEVDIMRGFGSGDTAQRVAVGEADFGIVDMSALVPMRLNEDLPVVAIASFYAEPFHGVSFRVDDGIEEPRDLEGRSIACSPGSAMMLLFDAFAHATGIDGDTVEWKLGDPVAVRTAFLSGQADAGCHPVTELPHLEAHSDEEIGLFAFVDHGVSLYSQMLVTTEQTIEERPDLVERFTRAALRGLEFAVRDPEQAVEILAGHEAELDADLGLEAWRLGLDYGLVENDDTERHGIGHIDPARMQDTIDTLAEASGLDLGGASAEEFYTSEFLP